MVVLDSGLFPSLDCSQQMGVTFVTTFLAQVAIVTGLSAFVLKPFRNGPAVNMVDKLPFFTRRQCIAWVIWVIIFGSVAATCCALRTPTTIFLDSTSIVERSCIGPRRNEYRLDRAKLKISFGHDPIWLSKRRLETAYLMVTQVDKPRPIFIRLLGRPGSKELLELAPEAMAEYSRYRSYLGVR